MSKVRVDDVQMVFNHKEKTCTITGIWWYQLSITPDNIRTLEFPKYYNWYGERLRIASIKMPLGGGKLEEVRVARGVTFESNLASNIKIVYYD